MNLVAEACRCRRRGRAALEHRRHDRVVDDAARRPRAPRRRSPRRRRPASAGWSDSPSARASSCRRRFRAAARRRASCRRVTSMPWSGATSEEARRTAVDVVAATMRRARAGLESAASASAAIPDVNANERARALVAQPLSSRAATASRMPEACSRTPPPSPTAARTRRWYARVVREQPRQLVGRAFEQPVASSPSTTKSCSSAVRDELPPPLDGRRSRGDSSRADGGRRGRLRRRREPSASGGPRHAARLRRGPRRRRSRPRRTLNDPRRQGGLGASAAAAAARSSSTCGVFSLRQEQVETHGVVPAAPWATARGTPASGAERRASGVPSVHAHSYATCALRLDDRRGAGRPSRERPESGGCHGPSKTTRSRKVLGAASRRPARARVTSNRTPPEQIGDGGGGARRAGRLTAAGRRSRATICDAHCDDVRWMGDAVGAIVIAIAAQRALRRRRLAPVAHELRPWRRVGELDADRLVRLAPAGDRQPHRPVAARLPLRERVDAAPTGRRWRRRRAARAPRRARRPSAASSSAAASAEAHVGRRPSLLQRSSELPRRAERAPLEARTRGERTRRRRRAPGTPRAVAPRAGSGRSSCTTACSCTSAATARALPSRLSRDALRRYAEHASVALNGGPASH